MLPSGWNRTTIGESASFLTGFAFASAGFETSGIRLLRGSNVKRAVVDWNPEITQHWARSDTALRRYELKAGDIVIAMDGALVGRSFARISERDLPAYLVQRVARLRGNTVDQSLLYTWITSKAFSAHIDSLKTNSAIPHLSPHDIRGFAFISPSSTDEQRLSATAIDDITDFIVSLERLIAKKQAIKQGMLQQLLTGTTRLPGFDAPWAPTVIGSLGSLFKGRGVKRDDVRPSGVPCIRYGELYTTFHDYTDVTVSFVSNDVAATALPIVEGDLLFAGSGETKAEIGTCVAYVGRSAAAAGGDIIVLRAPKVNAIFLASLLNTPEVAAMKASSGQGDAVVHINARAIGALRVDLPGRSEQDAIARVIVDGDQELVALVARLVAVRNIKQGMMQELLTGRTRLKTVEAAA